MLIPQQFLYKWAVGMMRADFVHGTWEQFENVGQFCTIQDCWKAHTYTQTPLQCSHLPAPSSTLHLIQSSNSSLRTTTAPLPLAGLVFYPAIWWTSCLPPIGWTAFLLYYNSALLREMSGDWRCQNWVLAEKSPAYKCILFIQAILAPGLVSVHL